MGNKMRLLPLVSLLFTLFALPGAMAQSPSLVSALVNSELAGQSQLRPVDPKAPRSNYKLLFTDRSPMLLARGREYTFETKNTSPLWRLIQASKIPLPSLRVAARKKLYLYKWDPKSKHFKVNLGMISPEHRSSYYHNGAFYKDPASGKYFFQMIQKWPGGTETLAGWVSETDLTAPHSMPLMLRMMNVRNGRTNTEAGMTCPRGDCSSADPGSLEDLSRLITAAAFEAARAAEKPRDQSCIFPAPYTVRKTSNYGMRRHPILRIRRMHKGIDFGRDLNRGMPKIQSVRAGRITHMGYRVGFGYQIEVTNDDGTVATYNHMSNTRKCRFVHRGQRVKSGEKLGCMGNSGLSTGPHLHLEVKRKGQNINPETWANFKKLCGSRYSVDL